jgi:hypothetical protein
MLDASLALLADVFTFLAFLHADDIAPMRARFLAPSALAKLDVQLCVPDGLVFTHRRAGKRGATERETERIRFIHFLCQAADFVALTGAFLKPTPRAARWLNHSSFDRAAELFNALCDHSSHVQELWRSYRLPASPDTLTALVDILRAVPRDERVRFKTILKLVPLPISDDPRTPSSNVIMRDLLRWLEWFGVIRNEPPGASIVQLTDWGACLLRRADAPALPADPPTQPLKIQRGLEISVPPHAHLPTLYELVEYATPYPVKRGRVGVGVYTLDRTRIERALERGITVDHLLRFLETATGDALPASVARTLHEWTDDFGAITLRRVTLLEARDPARLEEIGSSRAARACLGRTLSPRAMIVRQARIPALMRQLERLGMHPRVEFPRNQRTTQPSNRAERATILHLYLAARLGHELADFIPGAYRVPFTIIEELEQQLAPSDRILAEELVNEWQPKREPPSANRTPAFFLHGGPAPSVLVQIERAIQYNAPLRITYHTASRDETTTRVVEPLRIEWRNRVPYLVAFCRLRQDERIFRIDRILKLSRATR